MSQIIAASAALFLGGARSAFIPAAGSVGPDAPVITSFAPALFNPSTTLSFSFTTGTYDTFTQELYSDAGLTHLVETRTDSGIVPNDISGLTPATPYWLRCKITLGGVDSPWSTTAMASTNP